MNYNIITSYNGISNDNYVDKLIEFISNNEMLRSMINEIIFRRSFEKYNILIENIFRNENTIIGKDIEIVRVIKEYLEKLYFKELMLLFYNAEKDQFFSSLLTNNISEKHLKKEENKNFLKNINENKEELNFKKNEKNQDINLAEKITKLYLEDLNYYENEAKFQEKIGSNTVDIILGFKIPGIKYILDKILEFSRENILKDYSNNEFELRNFIDEDEI